MEVIYSSLKQKYVINVADGKNLGKVCDITFIFPEGKIQGLTVTGGKGFKFNRQEIFLPLKCVSKIGEDAVLVNYTQANKPPAGQNCPPNPPPFNPPPQSRRSLEEYE